jgi:Arc/MetJ-type ribon-helix-helix transcriptional regulator
MWAKIERLVEKGIYANLSDFLRDAVRREFNRIVFTENWTRKGFER